MFAPNFPVRKVSYHFFGGPRKQTSIERADYRCRKDGMMLAMPKTKESLEAMLEQVLSDPAYTKSYPFWIGLLRKSVNHEITDDEVFTWVDGTSLSTDDGWSPWSKGQPNDEVDADCVRIWPNEEHIPFFKNQDCRRALPYVCEKGKYNK